MTRLLIPFFLLSSVGCANDVAQELYDLQNGASTLYCECAISEGVFTGTVAQCTAMSGGFTQAQIDCLQAAFDDHASDSDQDIVDCQIQEAQDTLNCFEAASCTSVLAETTG